jgi:hypothetical protein
MVTARTPAGGARHWWCPRRARSARVPILAAACATVGIAAPAAHRNSETYGAVVTLPHQLYAGG